jgi:RHS repeat-associated protein
MSWSASSGGERLERRSALLPPRPTGEHRGHLDERRSDRSRLPLRHIRRAGNASGSETATNSSELGYTGALKLGHGLIYLNARVYNPNLGRFMQADSMDLRRYTYAGGDPINNIDPTGHEATQLDEKSWQQFLDYGNDRYHGGTGEGAVSGTLLSQAESVWDKNGAFTRAGGFTADPVFGTNFIGSNDPLVRNLMNPVSTVAGHWITAVNTEGCPASTETCTIYMDRWVVPAPNTRSSNLNAGILGDTLGVAWGLPQEILGILWAIANVGAGGHASFRNNGFVVENSAGQTLFGGTNSAIALGHFMVLAGSADFIRPENGHSTVEHEEQHTYQSETLGPFYLPAAALGLLLGKLWDGDSHGPHSFLEVGPQSAPPRPWP